MSGGGWITGLRRRSSRMQAARYAGQRENGIKDRFQLAGRRADDFQYFAGRGLALARLIKLAGELVKVCPARLQRMRANGALRDLGLIERRPFTGCPILPRLLHDRPLEGPRRSSIARKSSLLGHGTMSAWVRRDMAVQEAMSASPPKVVDVGCN